MAEVAAEVTAEDGGGDGPRLPASIEAAWGLRQRPGKGPKPGLSLERIVETAVKAADSDGIAAASMSRVAADLGVSTMSLYRYVAAKDELLKLMTDAAYGPPPAGPPAEEGWRAALSHWAQAELAALRRHPWILRIPISGPPITPNAILWLEQGLCGLRDTGLPEADKFSVMLLVTGFVRNAATQAVDVREAAEKSGSTVQDVMASYGRMLAQLIDPVRFPALTAGLASSALDDDDEDGDGDFFFGLERVLDGIEVLIRAQR
ncbi:TetR/AcrR family transcriptional regulator [Actinomadura alba]|uniref:TetR/AcrR family transcriptional regulator n=1 Tax=Actinomadura alba TaxID=406431 RepID=A0ABR7M1A3_9ACTN|nr:TetR/AcrR family transcriptional regulator C-terminal domain-containing protein [Actinomadura alba]MBC6470515.1 TetR/AcrR family transcriptional regulator [Actinomadura alba]